MNRGKGEDSEKGIENQVKMRNHRRINGIPSFACPAIK